MNANHKEFISIALTLGIVGLSILLIYRFIPSFLWATVIAIATYPLYQRWQHLFGHWKNLASFLFTTMIALLLIMPLSWLVTILVGETQSFFSYLQIVNREGGSPPAFMHDIPVIGRELVAYWEQNIGRPGHIKQLLSNVHLSLAPTGYYIRQVGSDVMHRGFQVGFSLLTLFFLYRDGDILFKQIDHIGGVCLGSRWFRYASRLPAALRATVNGTIVVGVGFGVLMGICYGLLGIPAPTLVAFLTAFGAMIPFVGPLILLVVALILVCSGDMVAAGIVVAWGLLVMFVADHFVKPVLIGGATQLPFLAVLFGILGGVEHMGLLGLFIGPIIMVLFVTLWAESQDLPREKI